MSDAGEPTATAPPPSPARPHSHTPQSRRRAHGFALVVLGLLFVLLLTLWPAPQEAKRSQLTPIWCLVCGAIGVQDILQNLLMLMPLGLGLGLLGWRWPRATLAGLALGFTIELLQYTVIPGRDASLSDVLTNTFGTTLGALVAGRIDWLLHPPPRDATRLAIGALGVWAALWVSAGWLLAASPGPVPWRAVLRPALIDAVPFPGAIVSAELSGVSLQEGDQTVPDRVVEAYARDTVGFDAVVTIDPSTADRHGLLEVRDGDSTLQFTVAEQGGALRFAMRTRSSELLLRPISFRMPPAPSGSAAASVSLAIGREAGAIVVAPRAPGDTGVRVLIGPHWLATLLLPVEARPGPGWEAFAYLWAVTLLLAVGWWAAHAAPASSLALAVAAFVAVFAGLHLAPPAFQLSPTSAMGWILACGGLALGLLLGRLLAPAGR